MRKQGDRVEQYAEKSGEGRRMEGSETERKRGETEEKEGRDMEGKEDGEDKDGWMQEKCRGGERR